MATPKTINDLESRLDDLNVFMAYGDDGTGSYRGYQLEAGRLRKAIARRQALVREMEKGKTQFFDKGNRAIALAEAEDRSKMWTGDDPARKAQAAMWAGIAFAIMNSR